MKMKKLISLLCAAVLTAVCAVAASASYAVPPEYPAPNVPTSGAADDPTRVVDAEIVESRIAEGEAVYLYPAANDEVILDKSTLAAIARASEPVTFVNVETSVTMTIDPDKMTAQAREVDLNIPVVPADDGRGIVIAPPTHGEYGFTISLQIPASAFPPGFNVNNARCYYVDDNGGITPADGYFAVINGNIFFEFDHASSYLIADEVPLSMRLSPAANGATETAPEEIEPDDTAESEEDTIGAETDEVTEDETDETVEISEDVEETEPAVIAEETTTTAAATVEETTAQTPADSNPHTGVTLAIGLTVAAGAVAVVSKKRK
jgi:hypothetical protein